MIQHLMLTTCICGALAYGVDAIRYMNLFRKIGRVRAGPDRRVDGLVGPEDLALTRDGYLIVSCDGRANDPAEAPNGSIVAFKPDGDGAPRVLWDGDGEPFHPHGIDYFVDRDTGEERLFVIDHRGTHDAVMIFKYSSVALTLISEVQASDTTSLNDLVAVSDRQFYVTSDHRSKRGWINAICDYLRLPAGYVLYFDGVSLNQAAGAICYANGIARDRDGRFYVASMLKSKLVEYERLPATGRLRKVGEVRLNGSPDNITLADDGGLVVAVHAKILDLARQRRKRGCRAPSMIVHIAPGSRGAERATRTLFADAGDQHCAASVAVKTETRLFIGSVYDDHVRICHLDSPAALGTRPAFEAHSC